MSISLNGMSRKNLEKLQADIGKQLQKLNAEERTKALEAARKAANSYGFALDELVDGRTKSGRTSKRSVKPKVPGEPKYAHPENPALTWTGKGRQPQWFKEALDAGKSPENMAIKSAE